MDPADIDNLNAKLENDSQIHEKIQEQITELDKKTRAMVGMLNRIHSIPVASVPSLIESVKPVLASTKHTHKALAELIPPNQFWRWKGMWTNALRTSVFVAAFLEYLSTSALTSLTSVSEQLGILPEWKDRFTLPVEDYLHGLITLVNELSRLAVNSVTLGNFQEPLKISAFVKDIFAGFTMLNLKNDQLRRRFDSLKYDVKKIEEVVYDVSLRRLANSS